MSNARRLMTAAVALAAAAAITAAPAIAGTTSSVSAQLSSATPATHAGHATTAFARHLRPASTTPANSPVSISTLRVQDEVVSTSGINYFGVALTIKNTDANATVDSITTRVSINGKKVGVVNLYEDLQYYAFNSKWGVGTVTLGPSTIIYEDANGNAYSVRDTTVSKGAQARMNTKGNFAVKRVGHRYTFNFYAANFFKTGYISAKSIQLQYKSKGTYHLYRTFALNSDAKAKFVHNFSASHTWRMVVVRTPTVLGGTSNSATI